MKTMFLALTLMATASGVAMAQTNAPSNPANSTPKVTTVKPQSTSETGSQQMSQIDRSFVAKAAEAGLQEVAEGKLALQKSNDPKVKDFAQKMVDDHTKANQQLQQIASRVGMTVPTSSGKTMSAQEKSLEGKSQSAFDRAYITDQQTAHRDAVKLFTDESKSGTDPALKKFAQDTLPTLEEHNRLAQSLTAK